MEPFFTINSKDISADIWKFNISLNKSHPVYAGHFPQRAVAPGVMLTQMIKNLIEGELQQELKMTSARNIKFLNMMLPETASSVDVDIEVKREEEILVNAIAKIKEDTYVKISACFVG